VRKKRGEDEKIERRASSLRPVKENTSISAKGGELDQQRRRRRNPEKKTPRRLKGTPARKGGEEEVRAALTARELYSPAEGKGANCLRKGREEGAKPRQGRETQSGTSRKKETITRQKPARSFAGSRTSNKVEEEKIVYAIAQGREGRG